MYAEPSYSMFQISFLPNPILYNKYAIFYKNQKISAEGR